MYCLLPACSSMACLKCAQLEPPWEQKWLFILFSRYITFFSKELWCVAYQLFMLGYDHGLIIC